MAKKNKQKSQKSLKKTLLDRVETILAESLLNIPKRTSEKKFRKTIQKAGKILTRKLAVVPAMVNSKTKLKKSTKKKAAVKTETTAAEAVS